MPVPDDWQAPVWTPAQQVQAALQAHAYAVLRPQDVSALSGCTLAELNALNDSWNQLAPDHYLKDGGHYRHRRHACFTLQGERLTPLPQRAHWQPLEYNALHGGMQRWFEPMQGSVLAQPVWSRLLVWLGKVCSAQVRQAPQTAPVAQPHTELGAGLDDGGSLGPWFVEAHQFRIDTQGGIGRPTPEGAHRDGVDFVAVFMVGRSGIKGGETRVFEAAGPHGQRFTLSEPWSLLLLDDARVIHESTPIQPLADAGHRDTLVITLRRGGFQGA